MKAICNIFLILMLFISCCTMSHKKETKPQYILYKNIDEGIFHLPPKGFNEEIISEDAILVNDVSIRYLHPNFYKMLIDTLYKYGTKKPRFDEQRINSEYLFIDRKKNDTLYADGCLKRWYLIRNNKKEVIFDRTGKVYFTALGYSFFFRNIWFKCGEKW